MPDTNPQTQILTRRTRHTGQHFYEPLNADTRLDMVLIPGGTFLMGSPDGETDAYDNEKPQHEVTVPQFFIGRYPITQAQWRVVAGYPQVERDLNPDPSHFNGNDNRPAEQVNWDDVQEFCQRLSQRTGRRYRLPSEAEWEYACRAGTRTPFAFGRYISTELANYNGAAYGGSPECPSPGATTEVGAFPPNPFGLHDMHGNVWEWCEDDWHGNYIGAPTDGSAWLNEKRTEIEKLSDDAQEENRTKSAKLLRGGSWNSYPRGCWAASRGNVSRGRRGSYVGFRVVCVAPSAL